MRRLIRPALEQKLAGYLNDQQRQIQPGIDTKKLWKAQRQTRAMGLIIDILRRMTGLRERCMYCEDSRGADVEHYWPRARFPGQVFRWLNFLLVCAACNRAKGDRLPLDSDGQPLLVDPTAEDPWDSFVYVSEIDEVAPRWDVETQKEIPKGVHTLETLSTLRHQAVAEGRGRTRRNLQRAVVAFLQRGVSGNSMEELAESLEDNDGYGLMNWYFNREGQEEVPFSLLRRDHPGIWAEVRGRFA